MPAAWPDALLLLHQRGWTGEMIEDACIALVEARGDPALQGRELSAWTPAQVRKILAEPVPDDETAALCLAAEIHERADTSGDAVRAALRNLDAFVSTLDGG